VRSPLTRLFWSIEHFDPSIVHKLTATQEITPHQWVHPDEER
jgi:hypothetical protein